MISDNWINTDSEAELSLLKRWRVFANERFAIPEHLIVVGALCLGNAIVASQAVQQKADLTIYALAFIVTFSFFFRLRCFDEVKDYHTDCKVNPTRPLARGLLTITQVKWMFIGLTGFELAVVSFLGQSALITHGIAVAYSYLMYREFFIGKLLAPRLTTYAVTHTFVSVLVAYSIFVMVTDISWLELPKQLWIFAFATWAIFNLFEFARKSYALSEERPHVPTYTNTFGIPGAVLLTLSQVLAAVDILFFLSPYGQPWLVNFIKIEPLLLSFDLLISQLVLAIIVITSGLYFSIQGSVAAAKLFRLLCSLYLILYFALLLGFGLFG